MKLCKKALSVSLASILLLTAMLGALPAVSAETVETQLVLETEDNKEAGMDAPANADWIADNLMKEAAVTVSGNPKSGASQNSQDKALIYNGEASYEWTVGESTISEPSVATVTAEFETPKTVKQIVLANRNNPTRFISEAKVTLTDTEGNTYVYLAGNIDKGGVPRGYIFSQAVHNVVKVEIVETKNEGGRGAGQYDNGFSYVGILDKRYDFTDMKVYYAKNFPGTVGGVEGSDGLEGVYVPSNAAKGNVYNNNAGSQGKRQPRLVGGEYKVTLYAKLIAPAVEDTAKTVLKLKFAGNTIDFNRSDFTETDKYVKIEKNMSLTGSDNNSSLTLEYQAGSGAVKIDRILIGPAGSATPELVQPTPPEPDADTPETELPGTTGGGFDPDPDKTWITANLLAKADITTLVNAEKDKATALFDGNEAVAWSSGTDKAVLTADFSALETKPTIKKLILVSKYSKSGGVDKAKFTFTTSDGTETVYTLKELAVDGGVTSITLKNAVTDVAKVTIESLNAVTDPGWAEVALLDKRYEYEKNYYKEYLATESEIKETGIIDPPSSTTEESFPVGDWPQGVINNGSASNYMIWSPQLNIPTGEYKVSVYAKLYKEDAIAKNADIFNIETFGNSKGTSIIRGNAFSKAGEYEIITTDMKINGFYTDRISFWNYNNTRFKIYKIAVHTENMSDNLPDPPTYTPSTPDNPEVPEGFAPMYFRDPNNLITLPYRMYVPADYSADKDYSFLLYLHGAGSRGYNNDHANNVGIIETIMADPEQSKKIIIVAPQCGPNNQWVDTPWGNGSYNQDEIPMSTYLAATYDLIAQLQKDYSIDENRMYITGLSMGGYGTWDMITRYPDLFAAAIPICGAGDPTKAELIKDMPIWAFHSAGDATVPSSGSTDMKKAIETAGGSIKYTEYPDDAHDAWTRAYSTPELYTWLFAQSKPVYGDANGDEVIDVRDLIKLKKLIAAGDYSKTADCNKDGKLNADDLVVLRKHLIGVAEIA